MRLSVVPQYHINKFSGATVTELESGVTNGVGEKRGEITYLTQRPSIDVFADASDEGVDARGRAIYYWETSSTLYILNNGTIYTGNYAATLSTSPTAGTKKARFFEVGTDLVLVNPENDEAFTITSGGVVAEITDTDFPPKQTPAVPLAFGGAVLDGFLFVLGENGVIYNSDLQDASTWGALDFREAEREPDGGVYLGKHHDNIVAYGVSTIEFFYNANNASGSPLNRRQDVSYNIGCSSGESVWEEADRAFFVGVDYSGAFSVYQLAQFQVAPVSNPTIDSFLTQAIQRDGYSAVGSGFSAQGHTYYLLTLYRTPSDIDPYITLCFDALTGIWSEWYATINDITNLPLIAWGKRTGESERYGEGILANGDLISINDNLSPNDTLIGASYVVDGYVVDGYVSNTTDTGTPIELKSRMGTIDLGTVLFKYPMSYSFAHDITPTSQNLTLSWSNEDSASFTSGVTVETDKYQKITRCGRFRRRNHEISYSGADVLRLEGVDVEMPVGDN